jgi:hypothetical protein
MPIKEATSVRHQQPIFDRLEAARKAGVISDYLLRWRGSPTGFAPKVTAWSAARVTGDFAHKQLVRLLRGLVGATQIVVLED